MNNLALLQLLKERICHTPGSCAFLKLLTEKYHVKTAFDCSPSITISSISAGTLSSIVSKSLFLLYI